MATALAGLKGGPAAKNLLLTLNWEVPTVEGTVRHKTPTSGSPDSIDNSADGKAAVLL